MSNFDRHDSALLSPIAKWHLQFNWMTEIR